MRRDRIPLYALYGEREGADGPGFAHIETIRSRSHLNQWEILPHAHGNILQILIVRRSSVEVTIDGEATRIRAPVLVSVPPGVAHGFRFEPEVEGDVLSIAPALFGEEGAGAGEAAIRPLMSEPAIVPLDPDSAELIATLAASIARECAEPTAERDAMVALLTRALLLAVARRRRDLGAAGPERSRHAERFARFRALVEQHYREHRPLAFYADALGITERGLNRLAAMMAGRSAKRYVAERLALEARRQLAYTTAPVAQIAYALGFEDPSYFSRFYRRMTGSLPREHREAGGLGG